MDQTKEQFDVSALDSTQLEILKCAEGIKGYVDTIVAKQVAQDDNPWGDYYPADATEDELKQTIARGGEVAEVDTVVRRNSAGHLIAIPFSQHYQEELKEIVVLMRRAASLTPDNLYRDYLLAKAKYFETNNAFDREDADRKWEKYEYVPVELIVTAEETYVDRMGIKGRFESRANVANPELKALADIYVKNIPLFIENFPIADIGVSYDMAKIVIGKWLYENDEMKKGSLRGQHLPNYTDIPGKLMLSYNEILRQSRDVLTPILGRLFTNEINDSLVEMDRATVYSILLHEVSHGYGGRYEGDRLITANTPAEEVKASVLGLYNTALLVKEGLMPHRQLELILYSTVSQMPMDYKLADKVDWRRHYRVMACIMWNLFTARGLIVPDGKRMKVVVNEDVFEVLRDIAAEILTVKQTVDAAQYERYVAKYQDPTALKYLADQYASDLPI